MRGAELHSADTLSWRLRGGERSTSGVGARIFFMLSIEERDPSGLGLRKLSGIGSRTGLEKYDCSCIVDDDASGRRCHGNVGTDAAPFLELKNAAAIKLVMLRQLLGDFVSLPGRGEDEGRGCGERCCGLGGKWWGLSVDGLGDGAGESI